jgi:hypothetical protein
MTPVSIPVDPAQPNQLIYPFSALLRIKLFDRDSYKAAFGVDAPNWDATQPEKRWFDSTVDPTVPGATYTYGVIDAQSGAITKKTISAKLAASVNLPGLVPYPVYVIAKTDATIGTAREPLNENALSTQDQAFEIAKELGLDASAVFDSEFGNPVFGTTYPPYELRRRWCVLFKGQAQEVGELLEAKYAKGIGHPFSWDLSGSVPMLVFAADPPDGIDTGAPQPGAEIAPPVRELLPNEKVATISLALAIQRTDMVNPAQPATGDGFNSDDRTMLHAVYGMLAGLGLKPPARS